MKEKKKLSVGKIVFRSFLTCLTIVVLIALFTLISYGMIYFSGKDKKVYVEQIDTLVARDIAIVPGSGNIIDAPSAQCKDRLDAAILLYNKGLVKQVFVSGDAEETYTMVLYLQKHGIPISDLVRDDYGLDTRHTIERAAEKYGNASIYFCTQELHANRSSYLMAQTELDGQILCVDTMFYNNATKSEIREYLAASKATLETIFSMWTDTITIEEKGFSDIPVYKENSSHVHSEDIPTPSDYKILDINPEDDYNVEKSVAYARKYALERNSEYPCYEQNCTNFVSQCLAAGGIVMQGAEEASSRSRLNVSKDENEWFCTSAKFDDDIKTHFNTSFTFINTDAFIQYFTEVRGYEFSKYKNDYDGKLECYNNMASGDVLILYDTEGGVAHIGLVSGMGDMNAYFCANTNNQLDYCVFNISGSVYPKFGVLHMSKE